MDIILEIIRLANNDNDIQRNAMARKIIEEIEIREAELLKVKNDVAQLTEKVSELVEEHFKSKGGFY